MALYLFTFNIFAENNLLSINFADANDSLLRTNPTYTNLEHYNINQSLMTSTNSDFYLKPSQQKSAKQAMLMSAIFPGSGHKYLGKNTRAGIFMATDIMSILALIIFNREENMIVDSYKMYANKNAGLRLDARDELYEFAHSYMSMTEYNIGVYRLARDWFLIRPEVPNTQGYHAYIERWLLPEEDSWSWENDHDIRQYRSIRSDKQKYELYGNFTVGALLLNRIISAIDSAIQTNKINRNSQVYAIPENNGKGISLIYEYRF